MVTKCVLGFASGMHWEAERESERESLSRSFLHIAQFRTETLRLRLRAFEFFWRLKKWPAQFRQPRRLRRQAEASSRDGHNNDSQTLFGPSIQLDVSAASARGTRPSPSADWRQRGLKAAETHVICVCVCVRCRRWLRQQVHSQDLELLLLLLAGADYCLMSERQ